MAFHQLLILNVPFVTSIWIFSDKMPSDDYRRSEFSSGIMLQCWTDAEGRFEWHAGFSPIQLKMLAYGD
ncbi:MAG: hypothetical protein NWR51_14710, partial [Akkermansiaceae bacterium]|nr:hypothetical protein [Akkermansiaceae bacterium]MDP4848502.1 hypothetical protein [Akkermansiaceae bacterium]